MDASRTILLADDEPDDVILTRLGLQRAGLLERFVVVTDGDQAIDYIRGAGPYADRARFPFPQLVLLDIKMPRVSGLEVLAWIRQQPEYKTLPVVMLTTSCYDADVREAYRLGANSFLTKPVDHTEFAAALKQMAEWWLHGGQLPSTAPFAGPPPLG